MALIQTENKLSFPGAAHLARRVAAKIRHCVDAGTGFYVAVSGVSEGMLDIIDNAFVNHGIRRQVRFIYESPIESLIIKCMPGSTHEIVSRRFMTKLHDKICAIPGHTEYSYDPVGSTRFSVSGKRSKEGDEGLKPADTRPHEEDWPSLMVEVGYSQTLLSLQECAHWWLTESRGQTRMVILIQVGKDPKSIRLERWECLPDLNWVSTRSRTYTKPSFLQYFDIDAAGTVSHEESHPDLVIPYNTVFDTPNPAGTDIVLSKAELSVWALHIFGRVNKSETESMPKI
ncbi:hypothetical protein HOY82DRAFT_480722 [Tuber indicum]|nr:hypothetical protein HOY82DRAFT_480722 [Tuber indicum]